MLKTTKANDIPVFISPHYYYPHDHQWKYEGALEALMHKIGMFDRKDPLSVEGFEWAGADWLPRYKPHINDSRTTVTSPHKVYGPETNDLVVQLRKRGIYKVILAGMSANLCTESHMRELIVLFVAGMVTWLSSPIPDIVIGESTHSCSRDTICMVDRN